MYNRDMYYTYILQSQIDKSTYVGFTANPAERLIMHNKGSVDSTKNKQPWERIWICGFPTKHQALEFEKYLKTGSGIAFMRKHLI